MDSLPPFGREVSDVLMPTFKLYAPILVENADSIRSIKKESFSYGPHERQVLDVYTPPKTASINGRRPVLLFEYGGGLVAGQRTFPMPMFDGLVHANVGAFFALKFGYTVVIADYRLARPHGATWRDGGEDMALAVEWIVRNQPGIGGGTNLRIDLFILGNSAGGLPVSTFLFHPEFTGPRSKILNGEGTRLRGVIMLATLFSFDHYPAERLEVFRDYFGDISANCPLALIKQAFKKEGVPDVVRSGARILLLNSELDPEGDCILPRMDFVREWSAFSQGNPSVECVLAADWIIGHNHISPFLGLSTGDEREEAWGYQVAAFCDSIRKYGLKELRVNGALTNGS